MATPRRPSGPPQPEIKQFTPEEIEHGMKKLQRRIVEVKTLQTEGVKYDDQRRYNVEGNIRNTILEIFGVHSPEYLRHQYHSIWKGGHRINQPERECQENFIEGTEATIAMLEGLVAGLEEKREDLGQDSASRIRTAFEGLDLNPRIASACVDLYRDGHYRNAVLDASVSLVNMVKEKSRRHDLDGAPLMRTVFSKNAPVLAFNELREQADLDEQEGLMHLFEGAVLALRNPRAHAISDDSPEQALEYIALLSLLAKKVDQARRVT